MSRMPAAWPLDYQSRGYSYLERANNALVELVDHYVLSKDVAPRLLDVGCGAGANARAMRARAPRAFISGIEPDPAAAKLTRQVCDKVFEVPVETWLREPAESEPYAAVILSDVIEHVVDPLGLLRRLADHRSLVHALWFISVPNYAVWYNRVRTLFGRFEYRWSGLYDRTHLRFFTRSSVSQLLERAGFEILDQVATPSLVQSAAPLFRRFFERDVEAGRHLTLNQSRAYRAYERLVEPVETRLCALWPELLAFQIVSVAKL